jgi:16S rRNA (uracil1498-N3)-methyltransferase
MRQVLLPKELAPGSLFSVGGDEFHHLANVTRLREGEEIGGVDPAGKRYCLCLEKREERRLIFRVCRKEEENTGRGPELVLFICLPKPAKMDLVVRMTVEAGVSRIVPVTCERSVIRERDIPRLSEKSSRWTRIARSALEQSGRREIPQIEPVIGFKDIASNNGGTELSIFAHEKAGEALGAGGAATRTLHELLAGADFKRIRFLIGPEGGLSGGEARDLIEKGFVPVYLGENILRTETAAVALCSAVNLLLLEKTAWKPK